MLIEKNTQLELLKAFLHDAKWWQQSIGYMETETQFIYQLLNARIYKENIPNLFERLQKFKNELETNRMATKNIKNETARYAEQLMGILEAEDSSHPNNYGEKHTEIKTRYEAHYTAVSDYKMRVFNYIGGIL